MIIRSLVILTIVSISPYVLKAEEVVELTSLRNSWSKTRQQALKPIDAKYVAALQSLKDKFTKSGNLESAIQVDQELQKLLKDALSSADLLEMSSLLRNVYGKWKTKFKNDKTAEFEILPNGNAIYAFEGRALARFRFKVVEGAIVIPIPSDNCVERWTPAGDKILVEQWHPLNSFDPTKPPDAFGYATRKP